MESPEGDREDEAAKLRNRWRKMHQHRSSPGREEAEDQQPEDAGEGRGGRGDPEQPAAGGDTGGGRGDPPGGDAGGGGGDPDQRPPGGRAGGDGAAGLQAGTSNGDEDSQGSHQDKDGVPLEAEGRRAQCAPNPL